MAWIYFQEFVGLASLSANGCDQSPIVNLPHTAKASYCLECNQVTLKKPLSGTMCELSSKNCYPKSTLSQGGSHARTSVLQEMESAWRESEAGYSLKSQDWLASYDPNSSSWKTCQLSLLEDSPTYVWLSLRSGTIVDGRLYQPQKLEPSIFENDGSYLPTPTASDYGKNVGRRSDGITPSGRDRWSITVLARRGELPGHPRGKLNPEWLEQAMGFPIRWTEVNASVMPFIRTKAGRRS